MVFRLAQCRQGRHQQFYLASPVMFEQNFGQGMFRPAATGKVAVQPWVPGGNTLPAGVIRIRLTAPDARVLQQLFEFAIHLHTRTPGVVPMPASDSRPAKKCIQQAMVSL